MTYENFIATAGNRAYGPCCIWQCAFQTFRQAAFQKAVWLIVVKSTVKGKLL